MEGTKFYKEENNIFYLHAYYPKRFREHKGVSEAILDYKRGYFPVIRRFTLEIVTCLIGEVQGKVSLLKEWVVCIMPSHDCGVWSTSLLQTASMICHEFNMVDGSRYIMRHTFHDKSATGGERTVESHINTIGLSQGADIRGKKVIVIDDVTTSGSSLLACKQVLYNAGAERVCLVAIGKTTHGTLLDEIDTHIW